MAQSHLIEFAVSAKARTMFQSLQNDHALTEDQIASALIDWFAQLPADEQVAMLSSDDATLSQTSLISVRRHLDFSA